MASLADLQFQQGLQQKAEQQLAGNRYQDAAKQASDLFLKGDIQGATGVLMQADPELAKGLLGNLSGPLNPQLQGDLIKSKTAGELEAQIATGNDPRSLKLLDAEAARQRLMAEAVQERKNSAEKMQKQNADWATQAWGKVTVSEPFKNFQEFKIRQGAMERALTDPSAYGDIGAVFGFMKALDPRSVVRETEYATAAQAGSLLKRAQNYISKAEKGEILQPNQRAEIAQLTKHLGGVYEANYTDYLKPLYKQAAKRGVPIEDIDPYNVMEDGSPGKANKQQQPQVPSKSSPVKSPAAKPAPGSVIIYGTTKYKVGADGNTLEEIE